MKPKARSLYGLYAGNAQKKLVYFRLDFRGIIHQIKTKNIIKLKWNENK